jgi:hypothetical protein
MAAHRSTASSRMCSVWEPEGTERNGSIPKSRDGSIPFHSGVR